MEEKTLLKQNPKETPEIMDVRQLAQYLGIGKSKIYNLIRQKKIPASRIGRQYRFAKQVIDNWLKERIITTGSESQIVFFKKEEE
jgi:excisionase family DNA binding protein